MKFIHTSQNVNTKPIQFYKTVIRKCKFHYHLLTMYILSKPPQLSYTLNI